MGFTVPKIKIVGLWEFILGLDVRVFLPMAITLLIVGIMIYYSYKYGNEKVRSWFIIVIFFLFFYTIINIVWFIAIVKELLRRKTNW